MSGQPFCRRCGESDSEKFYPYSPTRCRVCVIANVSAYQKDHAERKREINRIGSRRRRAMLPPRPRKRMGPAPWSTKTQADYSRMYRERHPDRVAETLRKYRTAHKDDRRAQDAERYKTDRARIIQWNTEYHRKHRAAVMTRQHARKACLLGNGGHHTTQDWLDKCELLGNVCIYCGESKPLTRDHKMPVIRGGSNDITNIVPACKSCNSRKRDQTAEEFLRLVAAV